MTAYEEKEEKCKTNSFKKKKSEEENQELRPVQEEKKRENFLKRRLSFGKNDAGELE